MFTWFSSGNTPLLIAHRGCPVLAPENTIAGFKKAIENGAAALELDVRLSKDGEVMVIHDSRLERTTKGHGRVGEKNSGELRSYSAGKGFHHQFSDERIPFLAEVLELARHRIGVNIEIKQHPRSRSRYDIVEQCIRLIREYHAVPQILISSFHHGYVRKVKTIEPGVATGVLHHSIRNFRKSPSSILLAYDADIFICSKSSVRKKWVLDIHEHGGRVGVYTVNKSTTIRKLAKSGVDFIFTDNIGKMKKAIA